MKSIKIRLVSSVMAFVLALSMLIIGVWAIGSSQTITMNGNVTFNIADDSLYIKDVKIKQDNISTPTSVSSFMPGYINGNFDMNLTNLSENNFGTFELHFYIINTSENKYNATLSLFEDIAQQNVIVTLKNAQIPAGTLADGESITQDTPESVILILQVTATSSMVLDLSAITINIDAVIEYPGLLINSQGQLYGYYGEGNNIELPTTYSLMYEPLTSFYVMNENESEATMYLSNTIWLGGFYYTPNGGQRTYSANALEFTANAEGLAYPILIEPQYSLSIDSYSMNAMTLLAYYFTGLPGYKQLNYSDGDFYLTTNDGVYQNALVNIDDEDIVALSARIIEVASGGSSDGIEDLFPMTLTLKNPINIEKAIQGEDYTVTSISDSAFYNASNITSINIPQSITSIGASAFYRCSSLVSVTMESAVPPTLGDDVFGEHNTSLKIYVPSGSLSAYQSATGWSSYASLLEEY